LVVSKRRRKKKSPRHRSSKPTSPLVVLLAIGACAGALSAFYAGFRERQLSQATVESSCDVVGWAVDDYVDPDGHADRHIPTVTIAHEVGGTRYERIDKGPNQISYGTAASFAVKYQDKQDIPCFYVAGHPELVVLFRKGPEGGLRFFAFGAFLLLVAAYVVIQSRRRGTA
jgi:hypothetical protein